MENSQTVCRRAALADLPAIMEIVEQAKSFMHGRGLDQWVDGYPAQTDYRRDIDAGQCWVLERSGALGAVFVLSTQPEDCYRRVFDGSWLSSGENYAVIHRCAVSAAHRGKGLGSEMIDRACALARNLGAESVRVDTHRDNAPMRGLLEKRGFTHCGAVYLESPENPRSHRVIYERLLFLERKSNQKEL